MKNATESLELCRLCNSENLQHSFTAIVLGKLKVKYFKCQKCKSLQTERPYWLDEAYSQSLSSLDTGAAQRNIRNLIRCLTLIKITNSNDVVDIGGGDGLLCRLLRDYGINCYVIDKYAAPTYAQGFTEPNFFVPKIVLAFEVIEHFVSPREELENIFCKNPDYVLLSTVLYKNQDKNWWYLAGSSGQHVFFYSASAMEIIAKKYSCKLIFFEDYILFIRNEKKAKLNNFLLTLCLNKVMQRFLKIYFLSFNANKFIDDYNAIVSKNKELNSGN